MTPPCSSGPAPQRWSHLLRRWPLTSASWLDGREAESSCPLQPEQCPHPSEPRASCRTGKAVHSPGDVGAAPRTPPGCTAQVVAVPTPWWLEHRTWHLGGMPRADRLGHRASRSLGNVVSTKVQTGS